MKEAESNSAGSKGLSKFDVLLRLSIIPLIFLFLALLSHPWSPLRFMLKDAGLL